MIDAIQVSAIRWLKIKTAHLKNGHFLQWRVQDLHLSSIPLIFPKYEYIEKVKVENLQFVNDLI